MQIFLTYDYELFFGNPTGTVDKCIIEPTNKIREIASRTGAKMVFFIDTGYLKKLIEFKDQFPNVASEYQKVAQQIKDLVNEGHDCQLHIHPHWEDCVHDGKEWIMNTDRYKLSDFSDEDIERIVLEYQAILANHTGKSVTTYRAGGWCLQPFSKIEKSFLKAGIKLDSTVFRGGKNTAGNYYYDFTNIPNKSTWKFSNDLTKEDENGPFSEFPISNYNYSPLFFWRLFILGRLNARNHKPIGDGYPMPSPGMRKKMLSKGMNLSASVDGYFVTKLNKVLKQNQTKGFTEMVVIGHPKAATLYSLKKLERFIDQNKNKHQFITFADLNL
ncbi:hypothetical protein K6119_16755 [Paracrocinitomix mangrovi]|uniref:hypothetical protein n=1 Tax=Paracrocinitomix mangrovi TaxID=2862509 RepID=UPI001C8D20DB|nr:hypothetical protein [Paracrocinitomix mangrovi]UKN01378.1 hypothetical protein K6119_16755 [Paracrocinitomix mangrovi]